MFSFSHLPIALHASVPFLFSPKSPVKPVITAILKNANKTGAQNQQRKMKTLFSLSNQMPSTKGIISASASAAATAVVLHSVAKKYIPREVQQYFLLKLKSILNSFSTDLTFVIEEYSHLNHNHLFKAAELYLESIMPPHTQRLKLSMSRKESKISFSLEKNEEEIIDTFNGVTLKWRFFKKQVPAKYFPTPDHYGSTPKSEVKYFELSFHKKHKNMVLDAYTKHVIEKSNEMKEKKKTLKLYTLKQDRMSGRKGDCWQSVNLDHPATFDTLAMDTDLKRVIVEDLERFARRKEFYKKVGKAWKRGYLLFGPPGTGKSSLIAAMANYLHFDIYDLELADVRGNYELRKLLISTGNRSILVVEDIDCSIDLQNRNAENRAAMNSRVISPGLNQVTLSGLLNFIDGLWSSCGDERIIVFTANHKEKLDPALLRPGRMDLQIHMSYCTPCGFKMLASNYLGIIEHSLFGEIEELLEATKVTPAEVGEQLMRSEEAEVALRALIEFLEFKKTENNESGIVDEAEAEGAEILEGNKAETVGKDGKKNEMTKIH